MNIFCYFVYAVAVFYAVSLAHVAVFSLFGGSWYMGCLLMGGAEARAERRATS